MLMLILMAAPLAARAAADGWVANTHNEGFQAVRGELLLPQKGVLTPTLELAFPRGLRGEAGGHAEWAAPVRLPAGAAALQFAVRDDFCGPTAGHHFAEVLVDGAVVWEGDVAGAGGVEQVKVNLPGGEAREARIAFRLACRKLVTNFGVRVSVADVRLATAEGEVALLALEPVAAEYVAWPAEEPLPCLPPVGGWTREASILQPWGVTQATAVLEADEWAPRLATEFGFTALIMLPPEAHNAITPERPITEEQFQQAVAAYRRAGMKLILYTSIMHCGHAPVWQGGTLGKEHPEWAMRDPAGGTVTTYGAPWLCPNTGAKEFCLEYTEGLVRQYGADAVMLDNNEFISSDTGLAMCYCEGCRKAFREYVAARFGARLQELVGLAPDEVRIPETAEARLWGLWLGWRNRVWAGALEEFRERLRAVSPGIAVLANTAYLHSSWELAADQQFAHEDAVLSETRGLDPAGTAAKMTLGRALAQGRPLWNYIGTFQEPDFSQLREVDELEGIVAASGATGANPWIVFYGFTGADNQTSLAALATQMGFWHEHAAELVGGEERADVAALISPESRDLVGEALLPAWLGGLVHGGVSVAGVWEPQERDGRGYAGARVVVATGAACMRARTAKELAEWVRGGGHLIVLPETSWRDEYGRWRTRSALAEATGAPVTKPGTHAVGLGAVECVEGAGAVAAAVLAAVGPRATGERPVMVHWRELAEGAVMALATAEPGPCEVTLRLPEGVTRATLHQPGREAQAVAVTDGKARLRLEARLGLVRF